MRSPATNHDISRGTPNHILAPIKEAAISKDGRSLLMNPLKARVFQKVTIVTEDSKDMMAIGSVGGSTMTWLTDVSLVIQIGVGVLTSAFLLVRIIHYLRHWSTPPTKR